MRFGTIHQILFRIPELRGHREAPATLPGVTARRQLTRSATEGREANRFMMERFMGMGWLRFLKEAERKVITEYG